MRNDATTTPPAQAGSLGRAAACAAEAVAAQLSRPALIELVNGDLGDRGADQGADDCVAWIMDAGMHAGVGNQRCERTQRHGDTWHYMAHAGRECERRRRVPGGKGRRDRHPHVPGNLDALGDTVRSPAPAEWLDGHVDDGRRERHGDQAERGSATSRWPSGEGKRSRSSHRQLGVVGRARDPAHRPIECRRWRACYRRIDRGINVFGILQPPQRLGRPAISGVDLVMYHAGTIL